MVLIFISCTAGRCPSIWMSLILRHRQKSMSICAVMTLRNMHTGYTVA